MSVLALLLADSRFPGGGHVHSGGLEEAAARGLVRSEADLPAFLSGRLRTAGSLSAVFAAAAANARGVEVWSTLDAELDARTPSAAQRNASRAQGKATARAASAMVVPTVDSRCGSPLRDLLDATPRPHHAIALGVVIGSPLPAALAAAYLSVLGRSPGTPPGRRSRPRAARPAWRAVDG